MPSRRRRHLSLLIVECLGIAFMEIVAGIVGILQHLEAEGAGG
jgi:hypothetical protein